MRKKGVSLIALIIIIIIMLILATIVVFSSYDNINKAKIGSFVDAISNIKDGVDTYYLSEKSLPIKEGSLISANCFKSKVDSNYQSYLESELQEHHDQTSSFYKVDLSKINVQNKIDDENEDRYYISTATMTVYDLKGLKVNGKKYFSITNDLSSTANINNEVNSNNSSNVEITGNTTYSYNNDTTVNDEKSPTLSIDSIQVLNNYRIILVNVSDNNAIKYLRYQYLDGRYPSYTQISIDEIVNDQVYIKMPIDVDRMQIEAYDMSNNRTVITYQPDE